MRNKHHHTPETFFEFGDLTVFVCKTCGQYYRPSNLKIEMARLYRLKRVKWSFYGYQLAKEGHGTTTEATTGTL